MASSLEVTIQNAIAANDNLAAVMHACQTDNGITNTNKSTWLSCLQDVYVAYSASYPAPSEEEFAAAIYNVWGVGQPTTANVNGLLTIGDLTDALEYINNNGVQVYSDSDINATVVQFFAEIKIVIDTESILTSYNNNSGESIWLGQYISMTDNQAASTGEGGNELNTSGLRAEQMINWSASNKTGTAVINLTEFAAGQPSLYNMIFEPVKINDTAYVTQVLPQPADEDISYRFVFTINAGSTLYTWDPFLGDRNA